MLKKLSVVFYILPFLFILILFYIPLSNLIISGFSLTGIKNIFFDSYYQKVFIFTLKQAFLSAFYSMIPGVIGGWILANYKIPGKNIIKAITTVPFVLPSIIVVLGFVFLFGNNGIINRTAMKIFNFDTPPFIILYSFKAIIFAHVFYNSPLFIRIVSSAWEKISYDIVEAAETLGASKFRVFRTAVLPQIVPSIIAAFSLVFILCFMSFAIVLVLGGGPKYTTIEVEIYRLAKINLDINSACSLAIIQSAVTVSFLFIYSFFQKKTAVKFQGDYYVRSEKYKSKSILRKIVIALFFIFLLIIVIMPLLMIIIESFKYKINPLAQESIYGFKWYLKTFSELGIMPVINSLVIASANAITTVLVSIIALSFAKRKLIFSKSIIETFFIITIGISSIIISLSYMKFMADYRINIYPVLMVIAAHSVLFLPLVFKTISLFYDKIDNSIIESAESIGAGKLRIFFTIELPFIKKGIITGAVLAFALSMGEINSTLMLASEGFTTIPVAIYRLIGAYNFNQACAVGAILIIISAVSFFIIDRSGSFNI